MWLRLGTLHGFFGQTPGNMNILMESFLIGV